MSRSPRRKCYKASVLLLKYPSCPSDIQNTQDVLVWVRIFAAVRSQKIAEVGGAVVEKVTTRGVWVPKNHREWYRKSVSAPPTGLEGQKGLRHRFQGSWESRPLDRGSGFRDPSLPASELRQVLPMLNPAEQNS